ncbi:MAG: glycosyltransferase, partial [Chloroflexota bacterium]
DASRFFVGRQWVGDTVDLAGLERLRGDHLRRILAADLSKPLAIALALDTLMCRPMNKEADEAWQKTWQPIEQEKLINRKVDSYGSKKVVEIELSNGVSGVDLEGHDGLYALIRSQGRPLGCVTLINQNGSGVITAMTLLQAIAKDLGEIAIRLAWTPPLSTPPAWPPITVIVCTRNRTVQLAECLRALFDLDYPHYEIVVVDNAPTDDQTAQLAATLPVRYIRENRPGLDWARNCGLREARYSIVAFTDDDVHPDRGWLRAIAQIFNDPEIMAVTGLVLPIQLETQAQNLFEFGYGGMKHGFERRVVRHLSHDDKMLLWASAFGVGANMAFRKALLGKIGGFDVALDVGTPAGGGGDVEMFHRLVARGYTLVYEPAALVWHYHRPLMADLEKLVSNNGRSFGCYLFTCGRNHTVHWFAIIYFALRFWLWDWLVKRMLNPIPGGFPRRLVWRELCTALSSPIAYLRSQTHARRYAHLSESAIAMENPMAEKGGE